MVKVVKFARFISRMLYEGAETEGSSRRIELKFLSMKNKSNIQIESISPNIEHAFLHSIVTSISPSASV